MAGVSIADAPDRGKLVSYPQGAPAQQKGAFTWYPVSVSEEHAFNAIASGEMTFPAPDGTQIRLRYERHAEQLDGNWTWVGRVVGGDPRQEAIITFGEQAVFGSIPQENGPPLSLQTRQGALWVVKMDPSKAAKPGIRGDAKVPRAAANAVRDTTATAEAAPIALSGMVTALRAPQTDANTIDAAIGYTAGFASYYGGTSQATTRLAYLIEVGNQAFNNSNVDGYLRLVRTLQVSYTDANANETALDALTGTNGTQSVPIPSSLVPLRTARDQYSADIAILVRKFTTPENDGCGIAWLIGADQTPITNGDAAYAYAVVSDGTDQGTDGFSYYCDDNTLSHESAHLMGSAHDRANAQGDNGQLQYGRYPYSFGLKTSVSNGNFYTIMAYGDPDQMPYRVFSNPGITFCGDRACGVANSEDNARSLNRTISAIAAFRGGIRVLDLTIVRKSGGVSGKTEVMTLSGSSKFKTYTQNIATALAQTGTDKSWTFLFGDYNRDGITDMYAIKKMGASGRTEVHVLNGADEYQTFLLHAASALGRAGTDNRWVFRLGDWNRDGWLDLYCLNKSGGSGRTEVHVLDGSDGFHRFLTHIATALNQTGNDFTWDFDLGDRDSDGVLDLFAIKKVGSSGRTEVHVLNGSKKFQSYLTHIASALSQTGTNNLWNFKVGDYNRDGAADVYAVKRNGSSGKVEVHVLNGVDKFQSYLIHAATPLDSVGSSGAWEFELASNE